jgi:hypothetical protein
MLRDVFYYGNPPHVHPRERKISSFEEAKKLCTTEHFWIINEFSDYRGFDWDFDFDILPDEDVWACEHINVWPSYWQKDSETWLCYYDCDDIKVYRTEVKPITRYNVITANWVDTEKFTTKQFDYSWHPDPTEPPFIYQFGTQWGKTHGPRYIVPGSTDIKYLTTPVAIINPDMTNWISTGDGTGFDYSWHPDGTAPPYIYQFGTILDSNDGPKYVTPGNDGTVVNLVRSDVDIKKLSMPKYYIKSTLDNLIEEHPGEIFWAIREDINYDMFDFTWRPNEENVYHINVFGSTESEITQTYFVNGKMIERGYNALNYIEEGKQLDDEYLVGLFKKIDMFYIDRGNKESQDRYDKLKERFPYIQKTRYISNWADTISRLCNRSSTTLFWVLNSELDYSEFDFAFYPNPWQMKLIHVFGTQWSHWGTTYVINKETFNEDTKYVRTIEHLSVLNFVKSKRAIASNVLYDVVYIDHGNTELPNNSLTVKYQDSYLNTFKTMLTLLPEKKEHYVWVCSSICDYSSFDFTYICDPFTKEQMHVFPSDRQKFGDTFLINVNKLRESIESLSQLTEFKVNYNSHQQVKRLPAPVFITEDSHAGNINKDFNFPYAIFMTSDHEIQYKEVDAVNLWSTEEKNILITHAGGTRILVPKEASQVVTGELYDYPYIKTSDKVAKSKPIDIIFFSNGETVADDNYKHLLDITRGSSNKVKRVDKVVGRVASQHAAANISDTPWYFLVNAKLRVNDKFDWSWQPDRLQDPKHYVFTALNPVNNLEYGHMAIVANNKKLTLNTVTNGLDFTLASKHQTLDINSGTAIFNTSEHETWRTSFRETLKIKHSVVKHNDPASKYRLRNWLNVAQGDYAEMCLQGAKDAVEYYESVNGDMNNLMLSYDWAWLNEFYTKKYK